MAAQGVGLASGCGWAVAAKQSGLNTFRSRRRSADLTRRGDAITHRCAASVEYVLLKHIDPFLAGAEDTAKRASFQPTLDIRVEGSIFFVHLADKQSNGSGDKPSKCAMEQIRIFTAYSEQTGTVQARRRRCRKHRHDHVRTIERTEVQIWMNVVVLISARSREAETTGTPAQKAKRFISRLVPSI